MFQKFPFYVSFSHLALHDDPLHRDFVQRTLCEWRHNTLQNLLKPKWAFAGGMVSDSGFLRLSSCDAKTKVGELLYSAIQLKPSEGTNFGC